MAKLVFEIWSAPGVMECFSVSERSDELRETSHDEPLILEETFQAGSLDEAMNHYYARNGWGAWKAEAGLTDQEFTDEEHREQVRYLRKRPERFRTSSAPQTSGKGE